MRYFTWKLEFVSKFFEWLSMVSCLLTSAITIFSRAHGVMLTHMVFQINKTFFTQSFSSVSNEISLVLDHGHFQKSFCGNDGILVKISWLHNQNSYQKKFKQLWQTLKENKILGTTCGLDIAFSFKWTIPDCNHPGLQNNPNFEFSLNLFSSLFSFNLNT